MEMAQGIQDGFALNAGIRMQPYRYVDACIAQLNVLRRANLYRCRIIVLPDAQDLIIPAYETFEYQMEVNPGAYLWALQYTEYEGESYVQIAPANGLIRVTDACTGISLINDFAFGAAFDSHSTSPANTRGKLLQFPLTVPRMIPTPGQVNVEIANQDTSSLRCQLLLYFAEPCAVIEGPDVRGSVDNPTMSLIREGYPFRPGSRPINGSNGGNC